MRGFNGNPLAQNPTATPGNIAQNACAANTTVAVNVTVTGARTDSFVAVKPRSALDLGLGIVGAYVSAANTVTVYFMNTTAGALPAGAAGINFDVMVMPNL